MDVPIKKLKLQLTKCRTTLSKGYTHSKDCEMEWLNSFCAEFYVFANRLQRFLQSELNTSTTETNEDVQTIFLCLTQIVTCIKYMELTIKAEKTSCMPSSSLRQHFLDRIVWCIDQLLISLRNLALYGKTVRQIELEKYTYIELMDLVLDNLLPFSSYMDETVITLPESMQPAMFNCQQIRSMVNTILGHTLAFANVALKEDKNALSALCQKVLRECLAFQDDFLLYKNGAEPNKSNRKVKAISLENALFQLEDYLNEALLRCVFRSFLDYDKLSIEKLRNVIRFCDANDSALDELIADFDVNIDRTTQIGVFAIAFAPNLKLKTLVRSCLASLESLDSFLIPSLQTKNSADIHSEILEQHFNEEIAIFKTGMQEIIDDHAFTSCYIELLSRCIKQVEKEYNKVLLQEMVQMGDFLYEHFQHKDNNKELRKKGKRVQYYDKFTLILRECRAILMCADQVDESRILKRFKIMRSILKQFLVTLKDTSTRTQKSKDNFVAMPDELSDSQSLFESVGILPSISSILYRNNSLSRLSASDLFKVIFSKQPVTPQQQTLTAQNATVSTSEVEKAGNAALQTDSQPHRCSLRRRESLRTVMFRRQKSKELEKLNSRYNATSLQISDILHQLTSLSVSVYYPKQ